MLHFDVHLKMMKCYMKNNNNSRKCSFLYDEKLQIIEVIIPEMRSDYQGIFKAYKNIESFL